MEKAKGRYIAFVDGDDSLALNFIEKLLFVITSSDADIAFCDFNIIGKGNEHEYSDVIYEDKESIIDAFISGQLTNRIMNKLYVRDSLGRVTFPNGRNIKEDAYWSSKVLMNATKVIGIPDALYNYRVYSGSSSQRKLSDIEIIGMYTNDLEKYNCFLNNTTSDIQKEAIIGLSEPIIRWLLIYAKDLTMFNVYKSIFTWCDLTGLEQYSLRDNTYKEVNELGKRIIREEFHRLTLKGKISLLRNKAKR